MFDRAQICRGVWNLFERGGAMRRKTGPLPAWRSGIQVYSDGFEEKPAHKALEKGLGGGQDTLRKMPLSEAIP
jgi:hypothetical protein